jgi:hypothetical protein
VRSLALLALRLPSLLLPSTFRAVLLLTRLGSRSAFAFDLVLWIDPAGFLSSCAFCSFGGCVVRLQIRRNGPAPSQQLTGNGRGRARTGAASFSLSVRSSCSCSVRCRVFLFAFRWVLLLVLSRVSSVLVPLCRVVRLIELSRVLLHFRFSLGSRGRVRTGVASFSLPFGRVARRCRSPVCSLTFLVLPRLPSLLLPSTFRAVLLLTCLGSRSAFAFNSVLLIDPAGFLSSCAVAPWVAVE